MKNLIALDFDGVLCDSARETGISGWKTATRIWPDMEHATLNASLLSAFQRVRPVLHTGFEAPLLMRLLFEQVSSDRILADPERLLKQTLTECPVRASHLAEVFGKIRDQWIKEDEADWLSQHSFFPNTLAALTNVLTKDTRCVIITTKQKRFVKHLLQCQNINFEPDNIFGLEINKSKPEILEMLHAKHPNFHLHFVEDRFQTLLKTRTHFSSRAPLSCYLVEWGYNTEVERKTASERNDIKLMDITGFKQLLNSG